MVRPQHKPYNLLPRHNEAREASHHARFPEAFIDPHPEHDEFDHCVTRKQSESAQPSITHPTLRSSHQIHSLFSGCVPFTV